MNRKETFRRYVLFVGSVFMNAVGISIITKAMLETSPISGVPYVLSLFTPLSMGVYTILWNILFVLIEMMMMTRKEIRAKSFELFVQIPIGFCFGVFIDIAMSALWWLIPGSYLCQMVSLFVGCMVLGAGVSLEVKASVAMVAGEYLVQVISRFINKEFGFVKMFFDVALVLIACASSFIFMGHIEGVREGTLVSALIVGPISHFFYPHWRMFDHWLNCGVQGEVSPIAVRNQPIVISITREYGSGGRLLGKAIAEKMGIKFYDKELISLVAKEGQMNERYVEKHEQRLSSNALLNLILQDYESPMSKSLSSYDALFVSQSRVIRQLAQKESCVIVGRCADYILADFPKKSLISIFCYTDIDDAKRRCLNTYHEKADDIGTRIREANRSRIAHYQHYTGRVWGNPHNYDLMINMGAMSLETICTLVSHLYKERINQKNLLL